MTPCIFVTDLHGHITRYQKLFAAIAAERPAAVFLGGDLLPSSLLALAADAEHYRDFVADFLSREFQKLREALGEAYPRVFLILGNDDSRMEEAGIRDAAAEGIWEYIHNRKVPLGKFNVYGYAYVPPTPFQLKDWERYDVSRYVDPGCISPEEGFRSVAVPPNEPKYATIQKDLARLAGHDDLSRAIFLFHTPPYQTKLDRAALDGKMIDHVPLDVHIGSIAVKRFIEARRPLITLHGHVHESARLTGQWREQVGETHAFSAAHDGPELALVRFDAENPAEARRELM
ncbi:MAG: metallophosphoesterase [Calditrichaeota bacterium]|nr:metallophosphoesterase [Calditrichota bacterium]MCB9089594.1 metallophosphoesterase [Calditrichia bacterium]